MRIEDRLGRKTISSSQFARILKKCEMSEERISPLTKRAIEDKLQSHGVDVDNL